MRLWRYLVARWRGQVVMNLQKPAYTKEQVRKLIDDINKATSE